MNGPTVISVDGWIKNFDVPTGRWTVRQTKEWPDQPTDGRVKQTDGWTNM